MVAHLADDLGEHARVARVAPLRRAAELAHADQTQQVAPEEGHLNKIKRRLFYGLAELDCMALVSKWSITDFIKVDGDKFDNIHTTNKSN